MDVRLVLRNVGDGGDAAMRDGSAARVVLVDDHPLYAEALTVALVAEGLEVVGVAERGDEVLALVAETRPDGVLLDLKMPGMDGYACLEQLRAQHPGIPVLVDSGADAPSQPTRCSSWVRPALSGRPFR